MKDQVTISKKELASLRRLAAEVLTITSRLEEEPAAFKRRAPRKGQVDIERAIARRKKGMFKHTRKKTNV